MARRRRQFLNILNDIAKFIPVAVIANIVIRYGVQRGTLMLLNMLDDMASSFFADEEAVVNAQTQMWRQMNQADESQPYHLAELGFLG